MFNIALFRPGLIVINVRVLFLRCSFSYPIQNNGGNWFNLKNEWRLSISVDNDWAVKFIRHTKSKPSILYVIFKWENASFLSHLATKNYVSGVQAVLLSLDVLWLYQKTNTIKNYTNPRNFRHNFEEQSG